MNRPTSNTNNRINILLKIIFIIVVISNLSNISLLFSSSEELNFLVPFAYFIPVILPFLMAMSFTFLQNIVFGIAMQIILLIMLMFILLRSFQLKVRYIIIATVLYAIDTVFAIWAIGFMGQYDGGYYIILQLARLLTTIILCIGVYVKIKNDKKVYEDSTLAK